MFNPLFFSNVNELPLIRIVDGWLYHVICVKQGLYDEESRDEGEGETRLVDEEENLFE